MNGPDAILYKLVSASFWWLGGLSPETRKACAVLLGRVLFVLDRKHRRIALSNLEFAFGNEMTERQRFSVARRVFENLIHIIFEIGWSLHLTSDDFSKFFTVSGLEHYRAAIGKGKGVLCLTAHFGNWELLPITAHMAQMPVRIVYRRMDTPFVERFFKENRTRFGAAVIAKHRLAMRKIYRELIDGFPVAMLMDQNVDWYEGVFVDFFNHRACTNPGMAMLAMKSGAPVIPVFMIRTPDGFHTLFGPELPLIQTGDRTKDIELNTQMYNQVIEKVIRRFPEQWFWVHQRWKTRPYHPWPKTHHS